MTEYVRAGKLRALAVTTPYRSDALPQVPTMAEAGVPGFSVESWQGYFAPAGTPAPIVARLSGALKDVMGQQEVKDALVAQGAMPTFTTPAEARAQIAEEVARWSAVIRQAGIQPD